MVTKPDSDDALLVALAEHDDDFAEALESLWDIRPNHFTPTRVTYAREGDEFVDIDFKWMPLTDEAMRHLNHLTSLKRLNIHGAELTDSGLAELIPLQNLEELNLGRTRITNAGLAALKELPQLRRLDLSATEVSDAGTLHLGWMSNLECLYLDFCREVSDDGLRPLGDLSQLRLLHIHCTRITSSGAENLAHQLPQCEIIR